MRLILLLACLCCLLTHRANAQVVQLDSGEVAAQRYICLDTATYTVVRRTVARVAMLEHGRDLDQLALHQSQAELQRCRSVGTGLAGDFNQLATVTQQAFALPPAKPLLLDPNFYKGTAAGAVTLVVLKFIFHL